jgi:hypothetical protein
MQNFKIIELANLEDKKFIEDFIQFSLVARRDPFRSRVMSPEQTKNLLIWGHQHGSHFWLVKDTQDIIIMRLSLRVCPETPHQGTVGFFEIDLADSRHLEAFQYGMTEAEKWFNEKNVKSIIAPIDINTWFNYRFSLPSRKFWPRFKWEPTTPPEYLELFKKEAFIDFAKFNSVFFPKIKIGPFAPGTGHMKRSYKNLISLGFTLRPFDQENFKTKELPIFYEISQEAFASALLFEPIDLETFSNLYASAASAYDFSPSCVITDPNGEVAGFLFAFFDNDHLVIKSIALKLKYQGLRLSAGMIYSAVKLSYSLNKKFTVSALVRTGLSSEKIAGNSQKWAWLNWSHDYVLVKKDITNE